MTRREEGGLVSSDGSGRLACVPTTRAPKIEAMLNRWAELNEQPGRSNEAGNGNRLTLMPHDKRCRIFALDGPSYCTCWRRDVQEIERLTRLLRDDRHGHIVKWTHDGKRYAASPRALWWHLNEWFLKAETVSIEPKAELKRRKGKQLQRQPIDETGRPLRITPDGKTLTRVLRNHEARYPIAQQACVRIAELWSLAHEPFEPTVDLKAAA